MSAPPPTDWAIVRAMSRYGGSFAQAIAAAADAADPDNLKRLKAAFPDLWERYAEMAVLDAAAGRGPQ